MRIAMIPCDAGKGPVNFDAAYRVIKSFPFMI
jgi:hypothetical protein